MRPPSQRWPSWTLLAILATSLGWTVGGLLRPAPADVDIRPHVAAYESLSERLPAEARIGFLHTATDTVLSSTAHFAAQFAFAPRLVDPSLSNVAFIVTPPFAPASVDDDPRLDGFHLTFTGDNGVRVYARASR